jgi:cellulose synthase/poly-beta-1,6-N-acetylglucosamine synthase-like glycosyltransferase
MITIALIALSACVIFTFYTYLFYPSLLWFFARAHNKRAEPVALQEWPLISISLPVYNEQEQIPHVIESLLDIDYPAERRQIVVISDGSTDRTNEIVRSFATRGVQLLALSKREGKTAAEAAGAEILTGDIVINTDASVRIDRAAVKRLIAAFADDSVGVASGRDVSISHAGTDANISESGYVGYEMWIRGLETRCYGIVGASGCFYGIRRTLHNIPLPKALSRDFAAPLIARENGFRSVSVNDAICYVPRTHALQQEYRRKVRTMTRGIETLAHKRHLLNPARFGWFAWMLWTHKVCRWFVPWMAMIAFVAVLPLVAVEPWARWIAIAGGLSLVWTTVAWYAAPHATLPRTLGIPAFVVLGNAAAMHAGLRAMHGDENATWEPTRRVHAIR